MTDLRRTRVQGRCLRRQCWQGTHASFPPEWLWLRTWAAAHGFGGGTRLGREGMAAVVIGVTVLRWR